jgi:hypothetical protein
VYFESLACAMQTGVDFRAITNSGGSARAQSFDTNLVEHKRDMSMKLFESSIPTMVRNNNDTFTQKIKGESTAQYIDNIKRESMHHCQCDKFCFRYTNNVSWLKQITTITTAFTTALNTALSAAVKSDTMNTDIARRIVIANSHQLQPTPQPKTKAQALHQASLGKQTPNLLLPKHNLSLYVDTFGVWNTRVVQSTKDTTISTTNANDELLPLLPNVTIQIRCSDMLYCMSSLGCQVPGGGYGVLPFSAYLDLIPNGTSLIYILSDSPKRANQGKDCGIVLDELVAYLSAQFPHTDVYVKRGGSVFLTMVQMMYSPITICSASTFCFWPALASTSKVYFPRTSTIANRTMPYLTPAWNWILEPQIMQGDGSKRENLQSLLSRLKAPLKLVTAPYVL